MRWTIALGALILLAGCIGLGGEGEGDDVEPQAVNETSDVELPLLKNDQAHVNVTVPVVLVGFSDDQAQTLQEELDDEQVHHVTSDFPQVLPPPSPDESREGRVGLTPIDLGIVPTASYDVQQLPNETEEDLDERLGLWTASGTVAPGHALEAFLADELDPNPDAPSLVLLNSDGLDNGPDEWRYQYTKGYHQPVDSFGENEPLHLLEIAHQGIQPDDASSIEDIVHEVTHYRLLQGSVYPMPTAECHAITFITAYRPTALSNHDDNMQDPEELFKPESLEAAFQNLTSRLNATVHVDAKVLELPVDDPALDALSRGEFATFEAQRGWIIENWDDYWVEHEGCEAYVSFLVHTDAASVFTGVGGIGLYNEQVGYRVALSWVNEPWRYLTDNDSALSPVSPRNQGESMDEYNFVDYLHAHEAGHAIGMRHPHDISTSDSSGSTTAHEDVWSTMSYSNEGRAVDFGAIDQANFARNTVGVLLKEALDAGHSEQELEPALEHIGTYEWDKAAEELRDLLGSATEGTETSDEGSVKAWYLHEEPWTH